MHAHAPGTDTRILRIVNSQTNFRQWKIVVDITDHALYYTILVLSINFVQ